MLSEIERYENETLPETLFKLGTLKKAGKLICTWDEIANALNELYAHNYTESRYRKLYKKLKNEAFSDEQILYTSNLDLNLKNNIREIEKQRVKIRNEKNEYRKDLRTEALFDEILERIDKNLERIENVAKPDLSEEDPAKAMYVLLSDIHYGLKFNAFNNEYSPETAEKRVLKYAHKIVEIGKRNDIRICYVSLLGDLISGIIHDQIRIENAENAVDQTMHVAELVSEFIRILSENFSLVLVNSVSGNHSRLAEKDNALRTERLDDIVFWYCKTRFEKVSNVEFLKSNIDATIETFTIFDKVYVCVHGDFDQNAEESVRRISELIGKQIDYFISGHKHIAESRIDLTGYIRNGTVVSGGDDYTVRKRLFGPAVQVCMICSKDGVEAIYPIRL